MADDLQFPGIAPHRPAGQFPIVCHMIFVSEEAVDNRLNGESLSDNEENEHTLKRCAITGTLLRRADFCDLPCFVLNVILFLLLVKIIFEGI